ncbi:MAG: hypothetical protein EHM21_16320, partial [Chloroflexi bacterium]
METINQSAVSLLWPNGAGTPKSGLLSENAGNDLGINTLAMQMAFPSHLSSRLRDILLSPVDDEATIQYRQEVLEDCLSSPAMMARLEELLPRLAHLGLLASYP